MLWPKPLYCSGNATICWKENAETSRAVLKAINDVVLHYMREANVDEKLHPVTTAALVALAKSFESLANDMKSVREEKVTNNEALRKVFTDLAIDPAATLR
jgi:hypothetical protein